MFCIYLRTNSDLCHLQHKLIGFYNPDEKCLQRGTDWVFKYTPGSPKWSPSLRFSHQNPVFISALPHTCYMNRPSILLDCITRTILGEQYRSLSSSLCSFVHSPVTSSLFCANILNTLFSNTLSLPSSLHVSDQV